MNTDNPRKLIEAAFSSPKAAFHRRSILLPGEPLDLDEIAKSAVENDDDEDRLADYGPDTVFEDMGLKQTPFFAFFWQSLGPMVWECYLNLVHLDGDLALVCRTQDASPCRQAFALVKHPSDPAVMSAFFKALINQNGSAFGIDLFGSLPSNTHNKVEEIIPEEVVRTAYWKGLVWAEKVSDVDWNGLAEEVIARQKSPIMYPLEILKSFGGGGGVDPRKWLEDRAEANGRLTVRAKRAIFDAFFKQSYGPY